MRKRKISTEFIVPEWVTYQILHEIIFLGLRDHSFGEEGKRLSLETIYSDKKEELIFELEEF
jgi:hypothetical protein